jgi:hypothetical protein
MTLNSKVHKSNAPTGRALDRSVASSDWGSKLGYSRDAIGAVNRESIELMHELKARHAHRTTPIVVSGCVGPRGDGYDPGQSCPPPRLRPIMLIRLAFVASSAPGASERTLYFKASLIRIARRAAASAA